MTWAERRDGAPSFRIKTPWPAHGQFPNSGFGILWAPCQHFKKIIFTAEIFLTLRFDARDLVLFYCIIFCYFLNFDDGPGIPFFAGAKLPEPGSWRK